MKELKYPLACIPSNGTQSMIDEVNKTQPNSIFSHTCSLLIAIQGTNLNGDGKVKYVLSLEDDESKELSQLVNLNHYSFLKMNENETKYFLFHHNHPKYEKGSLELILDGKYGIFEVDVCVDIIKDGKNSTICNKLITIDASTPSLSQGFKRLLFNEADNPEAYKGTYHVQIKAKEYSGLIFGFTEIENTSNGSYLAREIKAGLSITDSLRNPQTPMFYTFELNPSLEASSVRISLMPMRGDFIIAVSNSDKKPSLTQNHWMTNEDNLMITDDDPNYLSSGFYTIGVFPVSEKDKFESITEYSANEFPVSDELYNLEQSEKDKYNYNQLFKFQLKWSYTDKHALLFPGIPEYGRLLHHSECFVIEASSASNEILVVKGSASKSIDLYASIGKAENIPSKDSNDFKAIGSESGFVINRESLTTHCKNDFDLKKLCHVHMCLYGKKHEEYMIGFTTENNPFFLTDSKVFSAPLLVSNRTLHFIYFPSKQSPTDIEEFSGAWGASMTSSLIEEPINKIINFQAEFKPAGFSHSTLNHYSRADISKLENPLITITVGKPFYAVANNNHDFDFSSTLHLEAGYYMKELPKHTTRVMHSQIGQLNYFYFYNNEPKLGIVIGLDSLDGGDAKMFLSRGKDSRPDFRNHEKMSFGYLSGLLTYNEQDAKSHSYHDLRGHYVLAVVANTDVKYSINWKHSEDQIDYPSLNMRKHAVIPAHESLYISLAYTMDQEIDLQIKTNHRPLMIYGTMLERSRSWTSNELEIFPNAKNNDFKEHIPARAGGTMVKIKDLKDSTYNRYLFTLTNDGNQPVEVEYEFGVSGYLNKYYPTKVYLGEQVEDYFTEAGQNRRYLFESIYRSDRMSEVFLKLDMISGTCTFRAGTADELNGSESKVVVEATFGHYFAPLSDFIPPKHENRGVKNIFTDQLYIEAKCGSDVSKSSHYKFTIIKEGTHVTIRPNTITENYVSFDEDEGDTYVYSTNGNETIFDINFQIDHFLAESKVEKTASGSNTYKKFTPYGEYQPEEIQKVLNKKELSELISVYFIQELKDMNNLEKLTSEHEYINVDVENRRVILEFKPRIGFFLIRIRPIDKVYFKYSLLVSTEHMKLARFGSYNIDYIPENATSMIYEVKAQNPGQVFMRLHQCFGSPTALVSKSMNLSQASIVRFEEDRFENFYTAENSGDSEYLEIKKPTVASPPNEFGYLNHSKNQSVFAVEIIEKEGLDKTHVDRVKPKFDDLYMSLSGEPHVYFKPVLNYNDKHYLHHVNYHIVVSKDPEVVKYYTYCEKSHLTKILKEGYDLDDVVHVFSSGLNPVPVADKTSGEEYIRMNFNLTSGHKYFMNVFAVLSIKRESSAHSSSPMQTLRVHYKQLEFEYRSFFFPIELMASTFGLIAVMLGSCWVIKNRAGRYLRKVSGFNRVSADVDDELEDYYLQVKAHFENSEKEHQPTSGMMSQDTTLNTSNVLTQDLDRSIDDTVESSERPQPKKKAAEKPKKKHEEKLNEKAHDKPEEIFEEQPDEVIDQKVDEITDDKSEEGLEDKPKNKNHKGKKAKENKSQATELNEPSPQPTPQDKIEKDQEVEEYLFEDEKDI